ncbi:MAG TPA: hypothetical protein VKV19_01780 [Ktedonobacteraceae bacterium]|nr:hypothetical protein [Ktedonobacteraceae bacterium]
MDAFHGFKRGQRVEDTHDKYGIGTITHFTGDEEDGGYVGGEDEVWVEFDNPRVGACWVPVAHLRKLENQ